MKREEFIKGIEDCTQLLNNDESKRLGNDLLKKIFGTQKNINCLRSVCYNKLGNNSYVYYLVTRSMRSTMHCLHHIVKHNCTIIEVRPRLIEFTAKEHDFSNVSYSD